MSSTNKKGAGLILSLLTAVAGAVGLGFCIVIPVNQFYSQLNFQIQRYLYF